MLESILVVVVDDDDDVSVCVCMALWYYGHQRSHAEIAYFHMGPVCVFWREQEIFWLEVPTVIRETMEDRKSKPLHTYDAVF